MIDRKAAAEAVDRYVEELKQRELEQATVGDALASRALLQGTLAGLVQRMVEEPRGIAIRHVEIFQDINSDYEHYFIVTMGSGARIRVTVDLADLGTT